MRKLVFTTAGWEDYLYWQSRDKQMLKKANGLLKEIQRDPFNGIGKPEPLKGELSGAWSRRLDDANRLVYVVTDSQIRVIACRRHYA